MTPPPATPPPRQRAQLPPLTPTTGATTSSSWKAKREQEERASREAVEAAAAVQMARLHAYCLHCFQVHSHDEGTWADHRGSPAPPAAVAADEGLVEAPGSGLGSGLGFGLGAEAGLVEALRSVRVAVLLELKAGEANHRQVLCVSIEDGRRLVLKTCATDGKGEAAAERLTGQLARRLGVEVPLVHTCCELTPLLARLQALQAQGYVVALPAEHLRAELWSPSHRRAPFVYCMDAARGKTLLELRPAERARLQPRRVLPAVGRLAALDALVNNWDRWPLPTLWQKHRDYLRMSAPELAAACEPLSLVVSMYMHMDRVAHMHAGLVAHICIWTSW